MGAGHYEFSSSNVKASDLPEKYKSKIIEKIKAEHPTLDEKWIDKLHFYISEMPLDTPQTYLQGKALDLFKFRFGEGGTYNVFTWIRLIQGEIRRKNNFPSDEIKTVEELKKNKCIGKSFLNQTLDDMEQRHKNAPDMQAIKADLSNSGWQLNDILRLDKSFPRAVTEYQDPTNIECGAIVKYIERILDGIDLNNQPLAGTLNSAYAKLKSGMNIPAPYDDKMYLISLILMVYNEKI